jgi:hypothetical protein
MDWADAREHHVGMGRAAAAGGTVVGVLALVVTALAWLFPDPFGVNERSGGGPPGPNHTIEIPSGNPGQADIEIRPRSGPPGTRVTVTGSGFPANAEIEIRFHVDPIGEARSDANGAFEAQVQIPTVIPTKDFPWAISASCSAHSARESFVVT